MKSCPLFHHKGMNFGTKFKFSDFWIRVQGFHRIGHIEVLVVDTGIHSVAICKEFQSAAAALNGAIA